MSWLSLSLQSQMLQQKRTYPLVRIILFADLFLQVFQHFIQDNLVCRQKAGMEIEILLTFLFTYVWPWIWLYRALWKLTKKKKTPTGFCVRVVHLILRPARPWPWIPEQLRLSLICVRLFFKLVNRIALSVFLSQQVIHKHLALIWHSSHYYIIIVKYSPLFVLHSSVSLL